MSVRRLAEKQPESFEFTPENKAWAEKEIGKYPPGRQASAVIALLWRAQKQSGNWLSKPAIERVAEMLDMPKILDNAHALMSEPEIDGALVGGASLKPDSFAAIVKY